MRIADEQGRPLDLGALSDEELRALAYERAISRVTLVAVVAEIQRRASARDASPRAERSGPSPGR